MAFEFRTTRLVEFSETDMAGIVHFTNFYRYMEQAEHAFYRELGLSVVMEVDGQRVSFPRVHASCDFRRPLRFEDTVEIRVVVREKKAKAFTFDFVFTRLPRGSTDQSEEVARGRMTVVCVAKDATGTMKAVDLPRAISERIEAAPPQLLASLDSDS
ncbi:MAG: thioesterase family protein [Phycisphaeraceae bacterium]